MSRNLSAIPSRPDHPERISSRLPPNVWVLGAVAFFNDTATKMSYWLLPQFLVGVLGAGPLVFGLIEGAAETIASVGRLLSGVISDRLRRRKPLAALGYTVANLAKPLLAIAQSWGQVFWIRFADRAAKGFRAAPRDALADVFACGALLPFGRAFVCGYGFIAPGVKQPVIGVDQQHPQRSAGRIDSRVDQRPRAPRHK